MSKAEYAVYKGDKLLALGTDEQCSKLLGISPQSVRFMATGAHKRRVAKLKNPEEARIAIKLED